MKHIAEKTDQASLLVELLPVGIMLSHERVITHINTLFANMFGYKPDDVVGKSLEFLYPSYRDFIDRGDQWLGFMRDNGGHCDERIMLRKGEEPICVKVKGRCYDRNDPYMQVACTFEVITPPSAGFRLSAQERAIVAAMGEGMTSKQIARNLSLSPRTIETYRSRLMIKTGARNASQLLALLR